VGILLFDEVEVLDFAGPYEVFSRTRLVPGIESRRTTDSAPFEVFTVASHVEPIPATGGLRVIPDWNWETSPLIDVLVVPGGFGTRALLDDEPILEWIREVNKFATLTTSVCTGSLLLARAGLLKNQHATTHWGALDSLTQIDKTVVVEPEARVVVDGCITSAGVSAGIDMALGVVESLHGQDVANETARYMDYPRHRQ
jgi:transcriptional regulator GlxA family with amidase domain